MNEIQIQIFVRTELHLTNNNSIEWLKYEVSVRALLLKTKNIIILPYTFMEWNNTRDIPPTLPFQYFKFIKCLSQAKNHKLFVIEN